MFSTDFIFRQQENLVDNQKSQAGYRPLRNKILQGEETIQGRKLYEEIRYLFGKNMKDDGSLFSHTFIYYYIYTLQHTN